MFVRIFTLRFNSTTEGFDQQPVDTFLADKKVLSIRDHFFEQGGIPYIALVVTYRLATEPLIEHPIDKKKQERRDESWRDLLSEADLPLFDALRNWRNERSKQEGIPPYVICNNRQLMGGETRLANKPNHLNICPKRCLNSCFRSS